MVSELCVYTSALCVFSWLQSAGRSFHKVEGWPVAAVESLFSFAALPIKESVSSVLMLSVPGRCSLAQVARHPSLFFMSSRMVYSD